MSIYKYSLQEATANLDGFYAWLNANKAGTFLENFTISHGDENKISILNGSGYGITFSANPSGTSWENTPLFTYTYQNTSVISYKWTNTDYLLFKGAILCSKGLIIETVGKNSNSGLYDITSSEICITVGSDNELAMVYGWQLAGNLAWNLPTNGAASATIVSDGISSYVYNLQPNFSANYTALAPLIAQSNKYLPYVCIAAATELPDSHLYDVNIGGIKYITNGKWYVRDGE